PANSMTQDSRMTPENKTMLDSRKMTPDNRGLSSVRSMGGGSPVGLPSSSPVGSPSVPPAAASPTSVATSPIQRTSAQVASTQAPSAPKEVAKPQPADARLLLKQARDLYNSGKLDEAEKLAHQADAAKTKGWGLFDDSPDKLLGDVYKTRTK